MNKSQERSKLKYLSFNCIETKYISTCIVSATLGVRGFTKPRPFVKWY